MPPIWRLPKQAIAPKWLIDHARAIVKAPSKRSVEPFFVFRSAQIVDRSRNLANFAADNQFPLN
jgi:hypothetical protein